MSIFRTVDYCVLKAETIEGLKDAVVHKMAEGPNPDNQTPNDDLKWEPVGELRVEEVDRPAFYQVMAKRREYPDADFVSPLDIQIDEITPVLTAMTAKIDEVDTILGTVDTALQGVTATNLEDEVKKIRALLDKSKVAGTTVDGIKDKNDELRKYITDSATSGITEIVAEIKQWLTTV